MNLLIIYLLGCLISGLLLGTKNNKAHIEHVSRNTGFAPNTLVFFGMLPSWLGVIMLAAEAIEDYFTSR